MVRLRRALPLLVGLLLAPPAAVRSQAPAPRLDRHGDVLPAGTRQRLGRVERLRQGGAVHALAISPDGKSFASAGALGPVCLWEMPSGKELRVLAGHQGAVHCVVFSPDGKLLASGGADKTIRFWDTVTGRQLGRCFGTPGVPRALAFSPDGLALASGGDYPVRTVRTWEVGSGIEREPTFFTHAPMRAVAFSPDGKLLASGGQGGGLFFWQAATGKHQHSWHTQQGALSSVHFAADGKTLLATGTDGSLVVVEAATGKQLQRLHGHGGQARALAVSADGKTFVSTADDGTVKLWDVVTGKQLRQFVVPPSLTHTIALSPDGKALATGDAAGRLRCWDVTAAPDAARAPEQTAVAAVVVSADARTVVSQEDGVVRLWDAHTGKPRHQWRAGQGQFRCVALAPGGLLAAGGGETIDGRQRGWVRLFDPVTGRQIRTVPLPDAAVVRLAFAPDGKTLAVLGLKRNVCVLDVASGAELRRFATTPSGLAFSKGGIAAFSPDARFLACADVCGPVQVWDVVSGQQIRQLGDALTRANALAFSPDSRTLALARNGEDLRLWELATGKDRVRFPGYRQSPLPSGEASALTFAPDGRVLAAGCHDVAARLWDVATGAELHELRGHRDLLSALAFAGDGRTLASASHDTTALLWDLSDLAKRLETFPPLTAEGADAAWAALVSPHALVAHRASWVLTGDPGRAVPLLKERLRPVPPRARRFDQLIADLDHRRYPVRQQASAELAKHGVLAKPALMKALAGRPSLEVRARVERLLEKIGEMPVSPEPLRELRAVEVLERLGTAEARQILEALARGEPEALVTVEAKASLQRLAQR